MGYYMAGGGFTAHATSTNAAGEIVDEHDLVSRRAPRMDKWNGRALGRAMTRVKRFEKMARRAVNFTQRVRMRKRRR